VRERLGALQAEAVGDPPPFGAAETLYGDRTDVETLAVALKTLPLMGKRFVVLRQPERLKEDAQKQLAAMLDEIPEATSFVVAAESPDMRKTLFAALRKKGEVETLGRGSKRDGSRTTEELRALVLRLASERGVKLTREGLAAFSDFVGEDTARMVQELEKLALLHGAEKIGPQQVLESLGGERAATAFALEGAVRERRMGLAIAHLRRGLSQGERPEVIVGQLAGELRSLLRARALLDSGLDERSAIREFGGGRGYFVVPRARNYRQGELVGALRMLGRIDVAAKTGQGDAGAGLERLLLRLGGRN
jgi:DNA polymerase III delta subunit